MRPDRYSQTLDAAGASLDLDVFDATMRVNAYGAVYLAKYAAEAIARNAPDARGLRGSILFTSSICATEGLATSLPYSVSKAAINGMASSTVLNFQVAAETL